MLLFLIDVVVANPAVEAIHPFEDAHEMRGPQAFTTLLRHAWPCAGQPRREAAANLWWFLRRRRVDDRDKPGHDAVRVKL